jgi:hypothetical protein
MVGMSVTVTIVDHPIAAEALTNLRDQNSSNQVFRAEMRRLSLIVIAEATRSVPTRKVRVTTPLCETDGWQIAQRPVLVPILRAGLGMLPAAMAKSHTNRVNMLRNYQHASMAVTASCSTRCSQPAGHSSMVAKFLLRGVHHNHSLSHACSPHQRELPTSKNLA